eukprot:CAMPEP_0181223082 /NCGR_PEP_ID=MMETSP1096-20121128/30317_1 /TAXON_ID=156174 ORGANISM="Chrysochromulina ericina, Strain CCMP281" /NCGR_SAMPLE_ID=MMETSP1096 /ASSEMBLY_ACC=CAM_ASM_000453 /LENGTH=84 /DNA_ID=CAMNT_0023315901 /DNA_START=63 /DNA_END=315 /DNA_ORIENTATION=-
MRVVAAMLGAPVYYITSRYLESSAFRDAFFSAFRAAFFAAFRAAFLSAFSAAFFSAFRTAFRSSVAVSPPLTGGGVELWLSYVA